jgi:hypothetical protein
MFTLDLTRNSLFFAGYLAGGAATFTLAVLLRLTSFEADDLRPTWMLMPDSAKGCGQTRKGLQWESTSAEEGGPNLLDLSPRPFWRTGVIYYHFGTRTLAIQGFLNALTGRKFLLSPTSGHSPGQPHLGRRLNKYVLIAQFVPTGLKKQGGIEHGDMRARPLEGLGLPLEQPADFRMRQLFQVCSLLL